mmetsp:Transcript_31807/g.92968  ORF Transcript_31807/g.92968 Transcript_31807/m.92968 type:complete len:371 (+) Transcript_31807:77-1189(+)
MSRRAVPALAALLLAFSALVGRGVRTSHLAGRAGWEELAPPALHHLWTSTNAMYNGAKPAPDVSQFVHEHCAPLPVEFHHDHESSDFDHAMMEAFVDHALHPAEQFATGLASMCSIQALKSEAEAAACKSAEMVGVVHKTMGALELFHPVGRSWIQWSETKLVSEKEAAQEPEHFDHIHFMESVAVEESVSRKVSADETEAKTAGAHEADSDAHVDASLAALHLSDVFEHFELAHKALEEVALPQEVSNVLKTAKTIISREYDAGKTLDAVGVVSGELAGHGVGDLAAVNDIVAVVQLTQGLLGAVDTMDKAKRGLADEKKLIMELVKGSDSIVKLANTWHQLPGHLCHAFTNSAHHLASFGHTLSNFHF